MSQKSATKGTIAIKTEHFRRLVVCEIDMHGQLKISRKKLTKNHTTKQHNIQSRCINFPFSTFYWKTKPGACNSHKGGKRVQLCDYFSFE